LDARLSRVGVGARAARPSRGAVLAAGGANTAYEDPAPLLHPFCYPPELPQEEREVPEGA
jgi:hypothetical protein